MSQPCLRQPQPDVTFAQSSFRVRFECSAAKFLFEISSEDVDYYDDEAHAMRTAEVRADILVNKVDERELLIIRRADDLDKSDSYRFITPAPAIRMHWDKKKEKKLGHCPKFEATFFIEVSPQISPQVAALNCLLVQHAVCTFKPIHWISVFVFCFFWITRKLNHVCQNCSQLRFDVFIIIIIIINIIITQLLARTRTTCGGKYCGLQFNPFAACCGTTVILTETSGIEARPEYVDANHPGLRAWHAQRHSCRRYWTCVARQHRYCIDCCLCASSTCYWRTNARAIRNVDDMANLRSLCWDHSCKPLRH